MLDFTPLDGKDAVAVNEMSHLATDIVREHFDPLIGKAQNDYMLARFQTPQAIAEQTAHGSRYYFVRENGQDAGFVAFYPRDGKMYLSKFYLKKEMRGKGYAHEMLSFVLDETKKRVCLRYSSMSTVTTTPAAPMKRWASPSRAMRSMTSATAL